MLAFDKTSCFLELPFDLRSFAARELRSDPESIVDLEVRLPCRLDCNNVIGLGDFFWFRIR